MTVHKQIGLVLRSKYSQRVHKGPISAVMTCFSLIPVQLFPSVNRFIECILSSIPSQTRFLIAQPAPCGLLRLQQSVAPGA